MMNLNKQKCLSKYDKLDLNIESGMYEINGDSDTGKTLLGLTLLEKELINNKIGLYIDIDKKINIMHLKNLNQDNLIYLDYDKFNMDLMLRAIIDIAPYINFILIDNISILQNNIKTFISTIHLIQIKYKLKIVYINQLRYIPSENKVLPIANKFLSKLRTAYIDLNNTILVNKIKKIRKQEKNILPSLTDLE